MKIVQDSTEHHFLTFIEKLRTEPGGWTALHFALSRRLAHGDIVAVPAHIPGKLHKARKDSIDFANTLAGDAAAFARAGAVIYVFADGDVMLLAAPSNDAERAALRVVFTGKAEEAGAALSSMGNLAKDIYEYQKLADAKLLSARLMQAYEEMADTGRLQSIALRRGRRREKMVLLVEDDRFTAAFAANMLNKEFDFVHAKTGEEAITAYIEHAPDVVLLDIHLPGLNGLNTLQALRRADPEAAVVMLSVDTVKQNIVTAHEGGALGFLKKPFSRERLLAAIARSPHITRG